MKRILLIVAAIITLVHVKSQAQVNSVWTEKYQQKVYHQIDSMFKYRMPDEKKRSGLVAEIIVRLKKVLPNGVKTISTDSLHKLEGKIAIDIGYNQYQEATANDPTPYLLWSETTIKVIKDGMLNQWPKDDLERGNKFCDCVITKLKRDYPDKLILPASKEEMVKVLTECKVEVMSRNKNNRKQ